MNHTHQALTTLNCHFHSGPSPPHTSSPALRQSIPSLLALSAFKLPMQEFQTVFPWPYPEYSLPIIQASMFPNHCISQGTLTCSGHDIPPQTWFSGLYVFVNNEVPRNFRGFSMSTYGAASSSTQHWAVDASPNLRRHYRSHGSSHCLPLITGGLADSKAILTAVTENWILIARAVTPPPAAHTPIFFFGTRTEVSKHSNTELDPCSLIL